MVSNCGWWGLWVVWGYRWEVFGLHLYSVHAGFHFQLLHSLPGLGDAGCAVVGDAVLHGAPVGG